VGRRGGRSLRRVREPADIDFFFDPVCPFAWIASRWLTDVADRRALSVRWRFISLALLNEDRDYEAEFPPAYPELHRLGRRVLRAAAATRLAEGNDAVARLYTEAGLRLHPGGGTGRIWRGEPAPEGFVDEVVEAAGLDRALAAAAEDRSHDELLRSETELALSRTGPDVGTPILTWDPGRPTENSLFGPVLSCRPKGDEAIELFDALRTVVRTRSFAEMKRSMRDDLDFG